MKTSGVICMVSGILLVIINIISDVANPGIFNISDGYSLGYLIGSHLFLIIGILLMIIAFRQSIKIRRSKLSELEESIKNIGK